jgi:hypothetical protein
VLEGGRVDERLERRPRLSLRLDGAVELAPPEIVAAHHRLHLPGVGVDRDERALDLGLLVEREARGSADLFLGDRHRDDVAALEGGRREPSRPPGEGGRRQETLLHAVRTAGPAAGLP